MTLIDQARLWEMIEMTSIDQARLWETTTVVGNPAYCHI